VQKSAVGRCVGICGYPYIPGREEHEGSYCLCAKGSKVNGMSCCYIHGVFMVNGMADRKTSELGGEGVAVCPEGLISWVFTPVFGDCGAIVKRGCPFFFRG